MLFEAGILLQSHHVIVAEAEAWIGYLSQLNLLEQHACCHNMTNLSPDDRNVIKAHPLENSLDHLRDALRKAEESNNAQGLQKATLGVLCTLLLSDAASRLDSRIGNRDVATDLLGLRQRMQNGDLNHAKYHLLVRVTIQDVSDLDIWDAVFNLVTSISRLTPPTSITPSFDGTPITHSSSSQQGDEQTKDLLDGPLFHEIKNCTYRGVGGFFSKYFDGKEWTEQGKAIYNAVKSRHFDGRWTDFPDPPAQNAVWEWLVRFQDEFLPDVQGNYYTSKSTKDLTGGEARRQLDLFIKRRGDMVGTTHNWKDVHVIGEHKQSKDDPKSLLLQLSRYMRDVFIAQPTRRFIHGFVVHGTTMELWVFDRSGPYSSGPFDIHQKPDQFIRAIAGYAMMSDEELGLDTVFEREGEDLFITITEDTTGKEKKLQLERDPLVVQRAIVCRGTNCFRTKDAEYVVKFSWTSDKRPPEADLLRLAQQKGVEGVARLLGYHRITSIKEMRDGLTFPAPHRFRNTSPNSSVSLSQSQPQQLSRSFGPFRSLSIAETSSKAYSKERNSLGDESKPAKRSRSNSQRSKLHQEHKLLQASENVQAGERKSVDDGAQLFKKPTSRSRRSTLLQGHKVSTDPEVENTKKRKSDEKEKTSSKRLKINSQKSNLHQEHDVSQVLESTQATSLYDESDGSFDNRLLCCLVISPAGRATREFYSISELLLVLRDGIKAHRSLYFKGKILHRDISENNIIITDPETADGFTGVLIDLDLAKVVGSGRSGARHQTGTMEFMAIQVLQRVAHTYRHDLESFFYVLLWICARRAWETEFGCNAADRPIKNVLKRWYTGTYDDIARNKRGDMHIDGFEDILDGFPQAFDCVKPLCRKIRGILFPYENGLLVGTPPGAPDKLYDSIIQAFDDTISELADTEGN